MRVLAEHPALQKLRRSLSYDEAEAVRCHKVAYRSAAAAGVALTAIRHQGTDWYRSDGLQVYRCSRCLRWHIGHRQKVRR